MDACLNKSTIGKDRYVCGVAFKDHTWCTYSMNATTDIEAQGLLRSNTLMKESRIVTG